MTLYCVKLVVNLLLVIYYLFLANVFFKRLNFFLFFTCGLTYPRHKFIRVFLLFCSFMLLICFTEFGSSPVSFCMEEDLNYRVPHINPVHQALIVNNNPELMEHWNGVIDAIEELEHDPNFDDLNSSMDSSEQNSSEQSSSEPSTDSSDQPSEASDQPSDVLESTLNLTLSNLSIVVPTLDEISPNFSVIINVDDSPMSILVSPEPVKLDVNPESTEK